MIELGSTHGSPLATEGENVIPVVVDLIDLHFEVGDQVEELAIRLTNLVVSSIRAFHRGSKHVELGIWMVLGDNRFYVTPREGIAEAPQDFQFLL